MASFRGQLRAPAGHSAHGPRRAQWPADARSGQAPAGSVGDDPVHGRGGQPQLDGHLVADRGGFTLRGRKTRLDCMCGGSRNQRFLPSIVYGLSASPAASSEPVAKAIARGASCWPRSAPPCRCRATCRRRRPRSSRRPGRSAAGSRPARPRRPGARRAPSRWSAGRDSSPSHSRVPTRSRTGTGSPLGAAELAGQRGRLLGRQMGQPQRPGSHGRGQPKRAARLRRSDRRRSSGRWIVQPSNRTRGAAVATRPVVGRRSRAAHRGQHLDQHPGFDPPRRASRSRSASRDTVVITRGSPASSRRGFAATSHGFKITMSPANASRTSGDLGGCRPRSVSTPSEPSTPRRAGARPKP